MWGLPIHSLLRGRLGHQLLNEPLIQFQYTPSHEGDSENENISLTEEQFQYTPSCEGDSIAVLNPFSFTYLFQYTPSCEGDCCALNSLFLCSNFNTLPLAREIFELC